MTKSDQKKRRELKGVVASNKMTKTLVVEVSQMKRHLKYQKSYWMTKRYYVHDEREEYQKGEEVVFRECRPLSRTKRWYALPRARQERKNVASISTKQVKGE